MGLQKCTLILVIPVMVIAGCGPTVKEEFYPSGKLRTRIVVNRSNELDGPSADYYESGVVKSEGVWANGKEDGEWHWYDSLGRLEMSGHYLSGSMHGVFTEYYANGSIKLEVPYKQGKMDGTGKSYFPSGVLESIVHYEQGLQNGTAKYYHPNGVLAMLSVTRNDTVLTYTEYDSLGNRTKEFVLFPTTADPGSMPR